MYYAWSIFLYQVVDCTNFSSDGIEQFRKQNETKQNNNNNKQRPTDCCKTIHGPVFFMSHFTSCLEVIPGISRCVDYKLKSKFYYWAILLVAGVWILKSSHKQSRAEKQ